MKRADIVLSTRHGGGVKRYHTWPTLRAQSVAEHSWQMLRLFKEVFPDAWCLEVAEHILYHDVPEVGTGDLPFPIKSRYPELKSIMDDVEQEVAEGMGIVWPELTPRQRLLVKVVDLLEMWEWGREEMMMGNRYAQPIVDDTLAVIKDITVAEPGPLHHDILIWMDKRSEG